MTTKEWLSRGWLIKKEIKELKKKEKELMDEATKITSSTEGERVQTTQHNTNEDKFIALSDISLDISNKIIQRCEVEKEIINAIDQVDNVTYRTLLTARYLNYKSFERIAVELNYNYYHTIKFIHPRALKEIKIPHNTTSICDNIVS